MSSPPEMTEHTREEMRQAADRLAALLAREHACMAEFIEALADFDRLKGWEALGYANLFWFLHKELNLSLGAAHYRKVAAELVTRFPAVLPRLRDGRLCLMTVAELAKVLTHDNEASVLPRFFGLSRREAAELVASIRPTESPALRAVVTGASDKQPAMPAALTRCDTDVAFQPVERDPRDESSLATRPPPASQPSPPPRPPEVVPLDAELRRLHVTVSKRLLAKIEMARDALSHSHPGASMDTVLEVGLDLVIERHRKRRGVGSRPRRVAPAGTTEPRKGPERIAADVKRRVWERDGGRCQWPVDGGGTCGSTLRLEFDHRVPRGLGGESDAANVRLLCRFHNQLAAREVYGDETMDRFTVKVPRASEPIAA